MEPKSDFQPAYTYPHIPPTTQQYPQRPQHAEPELGWFARNQKNKPQSNSVGGAALLFTTGGMSMAWGLGFSTYSAVKATTYMNLCWFVAAIIGTLIGAVLTTRVQKKVFMLVSTLMVLLGGILFISLSDDFTAVMIARHLNGFAIGFVYVPTMVMAGEEPIKELRGMVASSIEGMCLTMGVFLQIVYSVAWGSDYNSDFTVGQMHGLLCIVFSAMSLLLVFFLVIESPVFLLVRGQEQEAIDSLRRLQRPFVLTFETYDQLEEHKRYIAENNMKTMTESLGESIPALLKLCFLRGLVAMSLSVLITFAVLVSSTISNGGLLTWPFIIYGLCRWVGNFIGIFIIDSVGRKKPLVFSMLVCGALAIGVGVIFGDLWNILSTSKMATALYLIFVYQFFAGMILTSSSAYLSEAFPLAVKPGCIAAAFIVEMLVHIIIGSIDLTLYATSDYFYALGSLSLVFFLVTILCLPETKKTTLREAQAKFRGLMSTSFN